MTEEERGIAATERKLRDHLRKVWIAQHRVWGDSPRRYAWSPTEFGARYTAYRSQDGQRLTLYTTTRMFDGRFWAMSYRYVKVRKRYELEQGTVKFRAKRKDAKAICLQLLEGERG